MKRLHVQLKHRRIALSLFMKSKIATASLWSADADDLKTSHIPALSWNSCANPIWHPVNVKSSHRRFLAIPRNLSFKCHTTMTHFKIDGLKYFILLWIFLGVQIVVSDENLIAKRSRIGSADSDGSPESTVSVLQDEKKLITVNKTNVAVVSVLGKTTQSTHSTTTQSLPGQPLPKSLNSAALLRGFYVFVGLSVLVVAYIVFRSFRLNKTQTQMVRKYGILAHRQDVEMRPLPLEEEDDDDTTVFDATIVSTHGVQHQNA